jgi:hypothetical protein
MTAEIITFRRPTRPAAPAAALPAPFIAGLPQPANILTVDAVPVAAHMAGDTIVSASMALSAACREMAASLAILVAHCEAADDFMADIADGAQTIAEGGAAVSQATTCLTKDLVQGASTLAARAGAKS